MRSPHATRPLVLLALALGLIAPSCGGAGADGVIHPRYAAAPGSLARFVVTVREVPTGRETRAVRAHVDLLVRDAEAGVHTIDARLSQRTIAPERGPAQTLAGESQAHLTLDPQRRSSAEPTIDADPEVAAPIVRAVIESVTLPEGPVGPGQTWPLEPLTRAIPEGGSIRIERTARLVGTDTEGIATIEVEGTGSNAASIIEGASVEASAEVHQRGRVRAADGALVETETEIAITLRAALPDGTAIGTSTHRERDHVIRLSDAQDGPLANDWRPDVPGRECGARLDAARRRFEQAPRGIDLDATLAATFEPPDRAERTPIEEAAPILIADDAQALMASARVPELRSALAVYVLAPNDVTDAEVRTALAAVSSAVEIRRIARAQSVPPSPPMPAGIVGLRGRMRREGVAPWEETMAALLVLCDAGRTAYREAMSAPPEQRAERLRTGMLAALGRCGCETSDLARLERTIDLRVGGPDVGWAPLSEMLDE
ncbi:MAG: hypothetical protein AB7S26_16685 [Sandaracinaceae bacterium]